MKSEKTALKKLKKGQKRFSINFKRIGQFISKPRKVFAEIETENSKKADWKTPILVVAVIILLAGLLSVSNSSSSTSSRSGENSSTGNLNFNGGGMTGGNGPGGMGPMGMQMQATSEDDEESNVTDEQTNGNSSTFITSLLSALGNTIGFILTWLCLGSLVNLFSISLGGQGNTKMASVFTAWACIPFGIRAIMQIIYVLATGASINAVGLSGFITTTETNILIFAQKILAQIDIYLIWLAILLTSGIYILTKLDNKKSIIIAFSSILIVISIIGLFGLGFEKLASIEVNSSLLNNLIR